ncbi:glycosyltransferase [Henriciella marina]|uniref:glycosyltransferase n=1 Tax=Henriciella marina TaxID=453851 RepID=UPI001461631B|nr:glycosyltransferase [Henriciella marina]
MPKHLASGEVAAQVNASTNPSQLKLFFYGQCALSKSTISLNHFELSARINEIVRTQHIDSIFFVSAFPELAVLEPEMDALRRLGVKSIVCFLRGKDGYFWPFREAEKSYPFSSIFAARSFRSIYLKSLRKCDALYCVSEFQRTKMEAAGLQISGIVPSFPESHGVNDVVRAKEILAALSEPRFGTLDSGKRWVGVVGRIHKDKSPLKALDAFCQAKLLNTQLCFFGEGDILPISREVERRQITSKIAIANVPIEHLPDMYSAIDVCLHTACGENDFEDPRPSSVLSAAFAGKPVVAMDIGGVSECVSTLNIQRLFVDRHESLDQCSTELADKLATAFEPDLQIKVGKANREYIRSLDLISGFEKVIQYVQSI